MHYSKTKHLTLLSLLFSVLAVCCTEEGKNHDRTLGRGRIPQPSDTLYTQQAAMNIYAYQPIKALQIIDSAVVVGNVSAVRADIIRMRILSFTQMHDQLDSLLGGPKDVRLDSALAVGKRLLASDSIQENLKNKFDVLEMMSYSARMLNDTTGWMQYSRQFVDVCHEVGPEQDVNALRAEAEIGAALHSLGQHEQGMAKLDSAINQLEASFSREDRPGAFAELDALIVALKRKIVVLGSHDRYAETMPLARSIIEHLDDYEQHPAAYHDGSYREPTTDQKRADYISFYRSQAQNFITAAYASLGEEGNMLEAFEKIEKGVREVTAREHLARYNALQQQIEAERLHATLNKSVLAAVCIGIFALFCIAIAAVVVVKNREIRRQNLLLAKKIADAANFKKKYIEEMRLQQPPVAPDDETATDEQLFQYINDIVVREKLYLDPMFERQTIMDRFHLSQERVGTVFSRGSNFAKLTNYIQYLRLEYAARLLVEQPEASIVQVAADSGFNSCAYFSSRFRQHFGLSPSDYRRDATTQKANTIE